MQQAYVVQARGEDAGLVIRERGGYRFFAASPNFSALEQKLFRGVAQAERAARSLSANDNRPSSTPYAE